MKLKPDRVSGVAIDNRECRINRNGESDTMKKGG